MNTMFTLTDELYRGPCNGLNTTRKTISDLSRYICKGKHDLCPQYPKYQKQEKKRVELVEILENFRKDLAPIMKRLG